MEKEQISPAQLSCIIAVMIVSNNVILGLPLNVERDSWISLLLSMILVLPLVLMYARMVKIMPKKNIFQMAEFLWGARAGKIASVLMAWYPLHLAALVLRNFAEFAHISSLLRTPLLVVMIVILLPCMYLAHSGTGVLGRWMGVVTVITVFTMAFITLISYNILDFDNLLPIMEHPFREVAIGAVKLVPYPFGEVCMVLGLTDSLSKKTNPYRAFTLGTLLSTAFLLIIFLRCLCVLGVKAMDTMLFPTYRAASIINAGAFLERIEALISFMYLLAGITKAAICVVASSKGIAHGFSLPDYKKTCIPISLLALALCAVLYENIMEMFAFIEVNLYYAPFFQILVPVIMWVWAEVKTRRLQRQSAGAEPASRPAGQMG